MNLIAKIGETAGGKPVYACNTANGPCSYGNCLACPVREDIMAMLYEVEQSGSEAALAGKEKG